MGTTRDALRSQPGIQLGYVLCISGYKYLLTDRANPTASNIGWGATDWADVLSNLKVHGSQSQRLEPWSNELGVQHLTFSVQQDATDRFAVDMFKATPDIRSQLTVAFDSNDHAAGFNMVVKDAALFPEAEPVYVGGEAMDVTGTPAGNNIPIPANASGYWHAFSGDVGTANRFPGAFELGTEAVVGAHGNKSPVYVTSAPGSWVGKSVGLWVHRIVNGVWDVKAQAELVFAGTIASIGEGGDEDMETVVECEGINKTLESTILLQDQYSAKILEGHVFEAGDWIQVAFEQVSGTHNWGYTQFVAADSPTTDEFQAGRYTAAEFGATLANLCDLSGEIGVNGSDFSLRWASGITSGNTGQRFYLEAKEASPVTGRVYIGFNNLTIPTFLGFDVAKLDRYGFVQVVGATDTGAFIAIVAPNPHFLSTPLDVAEGSVSIDLLDEAGTFVDHTSLLPPEALAHVLVGGGEKWSYFTIDNKVLFLGQYDDVAKTITNITVATGVSRLSREGFESALRKSASAENGVVKQVYFSSDTFKNTIARLFASTDGNGRNHATYDVLPWGAAIPWELLGDAFLDSLSSVEQSGVEDSLALLIEKPTRLWDAVKSDFAIRMAMPVWKDEGIQIAQFTTPNTGTSDWILDETNKSDRKRTATNYTSDYICQTLKIEHSRNPLTNQFTDTHTAINITGYQGASGSGVTKTIKARNSFSSIYNTGATVEALGDMLVARFLAVLSQPAKVFTRSIPHTLFHMAPGDTVTFSDDFIRSPTTGLRGVTARGGVVIGVRTSLGISSGGADYFGECDILYTEEDRLMPLCPSTEVASINAGFFVNGWYAAQRRILLHQHKFSDSTATNDGSNFLVDQEVRITEIDPADPTAADSFVDTIDAINEDFVNSGGTDYDSIQLTNGFGAGGRPAHSTSKKYHMTFDAYDQVGVDQKSYAYQCDDADGQILDTIEPNQLGDYVKLGAADADITELPSRHSNEMFGDGEPLSAHFIRQQIRMANNLTNYKTAPHVPEMQEDAYSVSTAGKTTYVIVKTFAVPIGDEYWLGGRKRVFKVAPRWHRDAAGSGTANCRITSAGDPPAGSQVSTAAWFGPVNTVSFTSTATTPEISTTQDLEVVRSTMFPGFTFITVECGDESEFYGLAECWLGPLA